MSKSTNHELDWKFRQLIFRAIKLDKPFRRKVSKKWSKRLRREFFCILGEADECNCENWDPDHRMRRYWLCPECKFKTEVLWLRVFGIIK